MTATGPSGDSAPTGGDREDRLAALEAAIGRYESSEKRLIEAHEAELARIRKSAGYRLGRFMRRLVPQGDEGMQSSQSQSSQSIVDEGHISPSLTDSPVLPIGVQTKRSLGIRDLCAPLVVRVDSRRLPGGLPVAIVAGFDREGRVGLAQLHLGRALRDAGFFVVLIQDAELAEMSDDERWRVELAFDVVMGHRHGGYDFNSWRLALRRMPHLASASELLLINDSVIGPLWPIDELMVTIRSRKHDVVGAVESTHPESHLQSWFMWFGANPVRSGDVQRYLEMWRPGLGKRQLIENLEMPLARTMVRWGYSVSAVATAIELDAGTDNPSIYRWDRLLDKGLPFVKRELFLNHELAPAVDVESLRRTLRRVSSANSDLLVEEATRQLFPR